MVNFNNEDGENEEQETVGSNGSIEVTCVEGQCQIFVSDGGFGKIGLGLSKDSVGMLIDELAKCFNMMD